MSDRLVEFQDWLAQYPSWMVAGAIGFIVVVAAIVLWKAMRIALVALIVAVAVAGAWYVWENVSKKGPRASDPELAPTQRP
jgi:hypothetical protein